MIRIITDSTSDIGLDYAKELNIEIVPLKVIFNTAEYKDRIDLQPKSFMNYWKTVMHYQQHLNLLHKISWIFLKMQNKRKTALF